MSDFREESNISSRTIYINLHFKKRITAQQEITSGVHINPLFLGAYRAPAIHMNPNFLKNKLINRQNYDIKNSGVHSVSEDITKSKTVQPQHLLLDTARVLKESTLNDHPNELSVNKSISRKIISKSRTKIVREPAAILKDTTTAPAPLIRLSSKKLVRRTNITTTVNKSPAIALASSISAIGKYKLVRKSEKPGTTIKNKFITPGIKLNRKNFVARYALQRSNSEQKAFPTSSILRSLPINKKLQMLNINGVLYRSTRNKLQRKDASEPSKPLTPKGISSTSVQSKSNHNVIQKLDKRSYGRVLFVRGTKFVMDKNGFKLTRMMPACKESNLDIQKSEGGVPRPRQRIDIGGLTYIASTTQNVFVRTRNHLALAHLNTAKSRSLQLLTRRLVKSNIPCAIFQRIGKCIAHERGKCNKVHDKRQVTICPRFLRSECHNSSCLLSHNVSLAKMPVCKFFLQGVCVRTDCPYLHKKLSVNADICPDFLRGYCTLAEQCNKRHEFVCPEYERKGKCELGSCIYCKNRKRKRLNEQSQKQNQAPRVKTRKEGQGLEVVENTAVGLRYFIDKDTNVVNREVTGIHKADETKEANEQSDNDTPSVYVRPKVGALPAFIPLL